MYLWKLLNNEHGAEVSTPSRSVSVSILLGLLKPLCLFRCSSKLSPSGLICNLANKKEPSFINHWSCGIISNYRTNYLTMENNQLLANVQDTDEKNNFFIGQCCFITQAGGGSRFSQCKFKCIDTLPKEP